MNAEALTRGATSAAIGDGWRLVAGALHTVVRVGDWAEAARVAAAVAAVCATDPDSSRRLRLDLRADRVLFNLEGAHAPQAGRGEIDLAARISTAVAALGLAIGPDMGSAPRTVHRVELAIDALDIPVVRPFWKAVLAYTEEPGLDGPSDPVVDPFGEGPGVWFQQMDAPRPQRNRIHFDVCVPHDEAAARVEATLAAGGTLLSDAQAPAFWVLADPEGNEACICTWQGRD